MSEQNIHITPDQLRRGVALVKQLENWLTDIARAQSLPTSGDSLNGECEQCHAPFIRRFSHQRFCGIRCQKQANNTKRYSRVAGIVNETSTGRNLVCGNPNCKRAYTLEREYEGKTAWFLCPTCRLTHDEWIKENSGMSDAIAAAKNVPLNDSIEQNKPKQ